MASWGLPNPIRNDHPLLPDVPADLVGVVDGPDRSVARALSGRASNFRCRRCASSAITSLLVVFMVLLARAAILGLEINCGCFGSSYVKPSTELLRDSGLLLLALCVTIGAFLTRHNQHSTA
jgi:hypothetical protein